MAEQRTATVSGRNHQPCGAYRGTLPDARPLGADVWREPMTEKTMTRVRVPINAEFEEHDDLRRIKPVFDQAELPGFMQ